MNIINLPIEVLCKIVLFMDIITLEKTFYVFKEYTKEYYKSKIIERENYKNINIVKMLLFEIQKVKQILIQDTIKLREKYFFEFFINNIEQRMNEIEECPRTNYYIRNEYINSGYQTTKEQMLYNYGSKLAIIKHGIKYDILIEEAIVLFSKDYYSYPFSVTSRDYVDDIESIAYQNMFDSHVDNCICETIHVWCKGKYCIGCLNCNILFPSVRCKNIKQTPGYN